MIEKIKHHYRAGRSGQPMPARADRSVGEAALQTGAVVGVFMVTVWGLGTIGKVVDQHIVNRVTSEKEDREVVRLRKEIEIERLKRELDQAKRETREQKSE